MAFNPYLHIREINQVSRLLSADWLQHTPPRITTGTIVGDSYRILSVVQSGRKFQLFLAQSTNDQDDSSPGKAYVLKAISYDQTKRHRIQTHLEWMRASNGNEGRSPLLADFEDSRVHYMVFPKSNFTLRDVLNDKTLIPIPAQHVQEFSHQLVNAVRHIHNKFAMHGDICPENIGVQHDEKVANLVYNRQHITFIEKRMLYCTKIQLQYYGDFGLRRTLPGTDQYRAPEVVFGYKLASWSDCYSVGCVISELVTGTPLFPPCDEASPMYRNEKALLFDAISGRFPEEMAGKIELLFPATMDLSEVRPLRVSGISPIVEQHLESAVFIEWYFQQRDTAIGEVVSNLVRTNNRSRQTMTTILQCEYFQKRLR